MMGLIARSWRYYRRAFLQLFVLFGCVFLPLSILWMLSNATTDAGTKNVNTLGIIGLYSFRVVLPAFLASFGVAASAILVKDIMLGSAPSLTAALRPVKARAGDVLAGAVMSTAISLLIASFASGLDLLGITLIFYGPPILVQALLLQGLSYREAGLKTRELLEGNWFRLLGYLITIALGVSVISLFLTLSVAGFFSTSVDQNNGVQTMSLGAGLLIGLIRGLTLALTFPFLAVAGTIAYGDLRARARGLTTAKDKFMSSEPEDSKRGSTT